MTPISRLRRSGVVIAGAAAAAAAGLLLVADSLTFSLRPADPATGRARGCYTWLDDALAVREPSDRLRHAQLMTGGLLALGGPGLLGWRAMAHRRSPPR
jgi:hypothetical protein